MKLKTEKSRCSSHLGMSLIGFPRFGVREDDPLAERCSQNICSRAVGETTLPSFIILDSLFTTISVFVASHMLAPPVQLEILASASFAIVCVSIANHAMNLHSRGTNSTVLQCGKLLAALALSNVMFGLSCYVFQFSWSDAVVFAVASIVAYPMIGFIRVIFPQQSSVDRCMRCTGLRVSLADLAERRSDQSSGAARIAKRGADLLVAGTLAIVLTPLMAIIAVLVKMEDGGPALIRQSRVGLNGRTFDMLKFRSMCVNAEGDGVARFTARRDERVSRIGRVIRRHRLDELPQLINVLLGEMSLVGPRPERPAFVREAHARAPYYDVRHIVVPGMTGWAQINYPYGDSIDDVIAAAEYDFYYIANWSLLLDLSIFLRTTYVVLFGHGAR